MNEKISVIIPVYKVEKYLRNALNSVINQTYKNLEIILVDDGSPDNCGNICDEYAANDSRIKVIHKQNGGAPAARNDALRICTGDWIAYVDPDDWCVLDEFETLMKRIEEEPDIDILVFNPYVQHMNGSFIEVHSFGKEFSTTDSNTIHKLQDAALYQAYGPYNAKWKQGFPWDKIYRASIIRDNNVFWPEKIRVNDDVIFSILAYQYAKKVAYIDVPLYYYRTDNQGSIGHKFSPDRVELEISAYKEMIRIGECFDLSESYRKALYARVSYNACGWFKKIYFHPENRLSLGNKIKMLTKALYDEPIYTAIEKADTSKLIKKERAVVILGHRSPFLLYLLFKVYQLKEDIVVRRK